MHFLQQRCFNFDENFIEVLSQETYWQYAGIGSGKGLALNMQQAITLTNDVSVKWHIYSLPGLLS